MRIKNCFSFGEPNSTVALTDEQGWVKCLVDHEVKWSVNHEVKWLVNHEVKQLVSWSWFGSANVLALVDIELKFNFLAYFSILTGARSTTSAPSPTTTQPAQPRPRWACSGSRTRTGCTSSVTFSSVGVSQFILLLISDYNSSDCRSESNHSLII